MGLLTDVMENRLHFFESMMETEHELSRAEKEMVAVTAYFRLMNTIPAGLGVSLEEGFRPGGSPLE